MISNRERNRVDGFSIIEVLIVIVIIGVLAALTIVGFPGVIKDSVNASLRSDLENVSKQLKSYQALTATDNKYPIQIDDCPTPANGNLCIKLSGSNKLSYTPNNSSSPKNFRVTAYNEDYGFYYSNDANDIKCPLNFVIVPGSSLYGTGDFCAMKYEAKQDSSIVPASEPDGLPWVNVPQDVAGVNNDANDYSKNVANCSGCHLISEAEWLTIAHDALGVGSNKNTLSGFNYIYRGNSTNLGSGALAASRSDSNGYFGMSTSAGDAAFYDSSHLYVNGDSQRRTLTLSNGEVIWDVSGNVAEWTSGQSASGSPGKIGQICDSAIGGTYIEWSQADAISTLNPNPSPSYAGYGSLHSGDGIGKLCSDPSVDWSRGMIRGGNWANGIISGVFALTIQLSPLSDGSGYVGFRASR